MRMMIISPMFLQTGAVLTFLVTGLILLPNSIVNGTLNLLGDTTFGKYRPKFLIALEAIIMLIALYIFIHSTPQSSIILIHILLMDSVASVWMEAQTHSINQLPSELYIHDSAVLNNSLQVTKTIETPFAFSSLTSVMNQYLSKVVYPDSLSNISETITLGAVSYTHLRAHET